MLDLKFFRENEATIRAGIARKKFDVNLDPVYALDQQRREVVTAFETKRAEQNAASKAVGQIKDKKSPEFQEAITAMKALSAQVKELQAKQDEIEAQWHAAFLAIPNIPHESVPEGKSDADNVTVSTWGSVEDDAAFPNAIPHYELPWFTEAIDMAGGTKVTGAGFPFYIGDMARLVRGLIAFLIDESTERGYVEVIPPHLVNAASATATGQLPDKEGQMYHAQTDDFYLIPTAEVPVTNLYRDVILDVNQLPLKHVAYTPCFRREAGSYGKDVRGLNRLHQFDKVELVKWVHPKESFEELEKLRADAEHMLQQLKLPYRVLSICSKDIGFPHSKQYDLDVWAAGQKRWLEVSSCSNFTDFQARRANIRFRDPETGKPQIVHTLNGSALGLARVLAAILENYRQADGTVAVPDVLQKYVGREKIGRTDG